MMNEFDSDRAIRTSHSAETVLFRGAKNNVQTNTSFAQRKANASSLYLAFTAKFPMYTLYYAIILRQHNIARKQKFVASSVRACLRAPREHRRGKVRVPKLWESLRSADMLGCYCGCINTALVMRTFAFSMCARACRSDASSRRSNCRRVAISL